MEKVQLFYKKNTQTVYSALFLIGAVFIFFQIILPNLLAAGDLRGQIDTEQKKINDYKNSETVLGKLDKIVLARQADLVTRALPSSKDIQAIYLSLTQSAASANISVRGFSVKVGDIFQKKSLEKNSAIGVPFVVVNLLISAADPASLYAFSQALVKHLPLNTIVRASVTSGEGDMDIVFYYKPFDLSYMNRNVVKMPSAQDEDVLNGLPSTR